MKIENETLDGRIVKDGSVQPMTLQRRKARGFCTCPLKTPVGVETTPHRGPCGVHPKHLIDSPEYNRSRGLLFFDDRSKGTASFEAAHGREDSVTRPSENECGLQSDPFAGSGDEYGCHGVPLS